MTAAPVPRGIEQDTRLCWQGYDDHGHPFDGGEGEPHYYERAEVNNDLNPKRREHPCWHVTCAGCDYRYDEDGTWLTHFETAEDALKGVLGEWRVIDGGIYCSSDCEGLADLSPGGAA